MAAILIASILPFRTALAQAPDRKTLEAELRRLQEHMEALRNDPKVQSDHWADAQIFVKGARWALELEPVLDAEKTALVQLALRRGDERCAALAAGQQPWTARRGKLVRGFVSVVDGSTQPYGLVVPAQYDPAKPMRLDVVLHGSHGGRASGIGDLQFISPFDQGDEPGKGPNVNYIEVFPMGRLGENAYRFEGETDIDEAILAVCRNYAVDRTRIVLRGSSLGGVGTWQIGLKRPDRFVALGPTAGPVDTIEFANSPWPHFVRLDPLTPWQKKMLHLVDAIDYTANAGLVPVVAAMGDQDHYFSSHLLIQKEFEKEGLPFTGLVDVGGGHGVSPKVMAEQLRLIGEYADAPRDSAPTHIRFVTWTLKFSRCHWIEVLGLTEHYQRAEIVAHINDDGAVEVDDPENITRFAILPARLPANTALDAVTIAGTKISLAGRKVAETNGLVFVRQGESWQCLGDRESVKLTGKRPGLQGPIDDAFATPFLCVRGTGPAWNPAVGDWAEKSLKRFADEWRRHYRGDLPVKNDTDLTEADIARCNLILFGDPGSNSWIARIAPRLPVRWTRDEFQIGGERYPAGRHGLQLISPNPLAGAEGRYVVFNSGHTYHDQELRFSYMVFPRLGDWAVMKVGEPDPNAPAAGVGETVVTSGFFDENWQQTNAEEAK